MKYLKIIEPGFLTSVQDEGRYGHRGSGMPMAGAMDIYSHQIANLLVGNNQNDATLEITLTGPVIRFPGRMQIAITGADMNPSVNGKPVMMWRSINVTRGDTLSFGSLKSGVRSYLSVTGGILESEIMGSRSTYLRGRLGGHMGRKLFPEDLIPVKPGISFFKKEIELPEQLIPKWSSEIILRLLPGVDYDQFTGEAKELLTSSEFKVTHNSDRMGIRLSSTVLKHIEKADVISYPIGPGTIQVPGDGQAVIMLSDSQTVGGYTQIASVISADLYKTGQLRPGDTIKFKLVSHDEALLFLKDHFNQLSSIFGEIKQ